MSDLLALGFMRNAFLAGILLSVVLGVVSFFVVLRRFSFIGVGVAHSAFGGVALGILLGISPVISALGFSVAVANGIGWISRRKDISTDTAIGIFFALAMALGVIFIGMSGRYNVDLFGYLFGNILAITGQELAAACVLGILVLFGIILFFKEFLFIAFDQEVARVNGVPVVLLDHFFLTLLAIAVVICIKMVGIVLVSALLVIPGAAASQVARRYGAMIGVSVAVAVISTIGGLIFSYYADLASGAVIVTLAALLFFIAFGVGRMRKTLR